MGERHIDCWKCGLRRPVVAKPVEREEAICTTCLVWLFPEGLLTHGPLSNRPNALTRRGGRLAPPLRAYPIEWQRLYVASHPEFEAWCEAMLPKTSQGKDATDTFYRLFA